MGRCWALPDNMIRVSPFRMLPAMLALALPQGAMARDSLGTFDRWGAFRDPAIPRCYAISAPVETRREGSWRPFASIGTWPRKAVKSQLHVRLSRQRAPGTSVTLSIGDARFPLVAGTADAWARDKKSDAAIIAAMRSAKSMSIEARGRDGRAFADAYALRGAATAMDAAALGCAG